MRSQDPADIKRISFVFLLTFPEKCFNDVDRKPNIRIDQKISMRGWPNIEESQVDKALRQALVRPLNFVCVFENVIFNDIAIEERLTFGTWEMKMIIRLIPDSAIVFVILGIV